MYSLWQHTWEMRQETCCCRRGGDLVADELLDDKGWVSATIPMMLRDWARIDALAVRLMGGGVVSALESATILGGGQTDGSRPDRGSTASRG
jgi:hypothetical protein